MKKIAIGYAWGVINIGSIAIAPGLAALIRRHVSDAQITVVTSQGPADKDLQTVRAYYQQMFPHLSILPNPFLPFVAEDHSSRAWEAMATALGKDMALLDQNALPEKRAQEVMAFVLDDYMDLVIDELRETNPDALRILEEADLFCYTSGTMFNYGRAGKRDFWGSTLKWAMPLAVCRRLGTPFGVYANSFEELAPPSDFFYRALFSSAKFLSFRDGASREYVSGLQIKAPDMEYRPDSAFFFPEMNEAYARDFMHRHGLSERGFITATIRTGGQPGPLSGVIPDDRLERHMRAIRTFVEACVRNTEYRVLLCPEVETEIMPMKAHVFDLLPSDVREQVVWMDHFWMPDEAMGVYGHARMVCSMEVHSIVLALAAGTPVLHPQFWESGRKAWMLRDLGLEDRLIDIDAVDGKALFEVASRMSEHYENEVSRVRSAREKIGKLGEEAAGFMQAACRK